MEVIDQRIISLWDKYHLPKKKRIHVTWVARVSSYIAMRLHSVSSTYHIDLDLLKQSALLHDIDNGIPFLPGEIHPDAAVRILHSEQLHSVAHIVKSHSLYAILDVEIRPKKWEEKVLYLADKMVKYEVITVDERFNLWRKEKLSESALQKLERCYPLVKQLESEVFSCIHVNPSDVARIVV